MKAKKIVITGGPSTGKTAVVEELGRAGFHCLHEVIRTMTFEEKNRDEPVKMVSNPIISVPDPMKFNRDLLNARIGQYHLSDRSKSGIVFFDRGIPDVLAYMDCFGQTYGPEFTAPCETMPYDQVFLMPPWKKIHKTDGERYESFEESLRIHDCLKNSYERYSYDVIIVPKTSIGERVGFILNHINTI